MLVNLFLHYASDKWMEREYPGIPFERYADDAVCQCGSQAQAVELKRALEAWMNKVQLEPHPKKTRIVYCQGDDRRADDPQIAFDLLGYTFRPPWSKNSVGRAFHQFEPGDQQQGRQGHSPTGAALALTAAE